MLENLFNLEHYIIKTKNKYTFKKSDLNICKLKFKILYNDFTNYIYNVLNKYHYILKL